MAGCGRELRVNDKLESAAGESGVWIGVGRNRDEDDEDGAGLVSGKYLLGFGDGGVFRVGGFVEEIGAGIVERDAVGGVVIDGEGRLAREVPADARRGDFGCSGGRIGGHGFAMGGVAASENESAEDEKE